MGRAEHKRMHNRMKTKRKTKDADEIEEDMKPENAKKLLSQEVDYCRTVIEIKLTLVCHLVAQFIASSMSGWSGCFSK